MFCEMFKTMHVIPASYILQWKLMIVVALTMILHPRVYIKMVFVANSYV